MIKLNNNVITPTIFPDGTSQVWKLDPTFYKDKSNKIEWYWEGNEAELIWVNQLICLLYQLKAPINSLRIPYLPYARQDKEIGNETTFAKHVFLELLLKEHVSNIVTLDAHSSHPDISSLVPMHEIGGAIARFQADVIVFPDAGAWSRYNELFEGSVRVIVLDKVRNQLTGKIEGLAINNQLTSYSTSDFDKIGKVNMLIVDDLSDYGGTFKKAAKFLYDEYIDINVGLYVTHFLGHGDIASYKEAGITSIYTSTSLNQYRKKFNYEDDGVVVIGGMHMIYEISIKNMHTSEIRSMEEEYDSDLDVDWIWSEGNYGCDCNRELFFARIKGEDENWDRPCTEGDYQVHIVNMQTNEVVYSEF